MAREEKRKNQALIKDASENLAQLNYKVNELEKVMKEMEYNNSKTERSNVQIQQSIDNVNFLLMISLKVIKLTSELKTRIENLESVEQQVGDSQKAILNLERDLQDAERENDRHRAEAVDKQRTYQHEVTKGLDLSARATILENTLR